MSHHLARYPNLTYVAQDIETLGLLVKGEPEAAALDSDPLPTHLSHPLFRERRVRFYIEPWPWLRDLAGIDYSFGSRIHGNIAAILAGTPATVLAHDARTLELARYFAIPHRVIRRHPAPDAPAADAQQLYAEADLSELLRGHAARFATFTAYLKRHGLAHVFAAGEDPKAFHRQIEATPYPPAVVATRRVLHGSAPRRGRASRLLRRLRRELGFLGRPL